MASIIKVDTIQTAAGGTPTAADLGITGSTVQTAISAEMSGTYTNSTLNTYTDTGIEVSITPSSANSKILILVHYLQNARTQTGTSAAQVGTRITRDGSLLYKPNDTATWSTYHGLSAHSGDKDLWMLQSYSYLDSPDTTNEITYKLQGRYENGTYQRIYGGRLIVQEIAG